MSPSSKASRAAAKRIGFDTHLLGDIDEEIAQRHLVDAFARDLAEFAVLVAAAGEEDGEVGVFVHVAIAHAAAEKHGGGVEQRALAVDHLRETGHELAEVLDLILLQRDEARDGLLVVAVVGKAVPVLLEGMRQKEHIDAMEIMGVNTAGYLIMPKIIAALIVIPLLVIESCFVLVLGGYLASVPTNLLSNAEYIQGLRSFFVPYNVNMMFIKSIVFAFILTTTSCYQGYFVTGGSIELGKSSTRAVVMSDIMIIVADYVLAVLLTT